MAKRDWSVDIFGHDDGGEFLHASIGCRPTKKACHAEAASWKQCARYEIRSPLGKVTSYDVRSITPDRIAHLLSRRAKLTTRRDGWIDWPKVKAIDVELETVAPGVDNRVDLALGRSCAKLPQRDTTDAERAKWQREGLDEAKALANQKVAEWRAASRPAVEQDEREALLLHIADQREDMLDFLNIKGDTDI